MNLATAQSVPVAPPACASASAPRTVELRGGEILSLTKNDGVRTIEVRGGIVWLTATPAKGDLLLRSGDHVSLSADWPFVIQTMADTRLLLMA